MAACTPDPDLLPLAALGLDLQRLPAPCRCGIASVCRCGAVAGCRTRRVAEAAGGWSRCGASRRRGGGRAACAAYAVPKGWSG
jgi:hypothetical protein